MNSHEEHNDLCVGIDLGTTNSVLATINEKLNGDIVSKVVEISRAVDLYHAISGEAKQSIKKETTLPSCIYYWQEKDYQPLVGDFAKRQYPLRPHLVAKSIKSQMGNELAEGLSPDIPDKTPAQIASRILKHMLKEASKIYRCKITDAVITIPANFDSVMCKATLDAAQLAGIQVKNSDGTERPVLLSEPNAVIYDLINQIRNGELSSRILDLTEKKRVLVFDLGGGTLDITMHEIKRREGMEEVLKVDEIAANRYTLLGGDDFDEEIAEAMYERYLKQYEKHSDVVLKLKQKKQVIMPQLRIYAEELKFGLNEHCSGEYTDSAWEDEEEKDFLTTGGNIGGTGYSYDDIFSVNELEEILSVFMADELSFDDYQRIGKISNTRNIIYPILDVLEKTAEKTQENPVTVDAVIVNGGMSKFYMITKRLKKFFGFDPIVALDPDLSVARGAAVYHYYLHKYEEIKDNMHLMGKENLSFVSAMPAIQWGKPILNDSLYLGVKNGAVHPIIPTGTELPYSSPVMTGFKIEPEQSMIAIPIKSRNLDGSYRTISNGTISFNHHYPNGAFVAFEVYMRSNKVIVMKAWTSGDSEGTDKLEEGVVEISINSHKESKLKNKCIAPVGSILEPKAEINNLIQLSKNFQRCKDPTIRKSIAKKIDTCVSSICSAGNKEEFAEIILDELSETSSEYIREKLFVISRRIGGNWKAVHKKELARTCMNQIAPVLHGLSEKGPIVSVNIQAVYTLSICGEESQLNALSKLHDSSKYLQACLYAHAKTCTSLEWLKEELEKDIKKVLAQTKSNIQFSSRAVGVALNKDEICCFPARTEKKIVEQLCEVIQSGKLKKDELYPCILALGCICDQRRTKRTIEHSLIYTALNTIQGIELYYPAFIVQSCSKSRNIAVKMIYGEMLDKDEEEFLLTKLEICQTEEEKEK